MNELWPPLNNLPHFSVLIFKNMKMEPNDALYEIKLSPNKIFARCFLWLEEGIQRTLLSYYSLSHITGTRSGLNSFVCDRLESSIQEHLRTSKDTTDWQQGLYAACPSEECSPRVVSENRPLYDSIQPVLIAYSPLRSAFCRSCGEWDVKNHTGWGLCFPGTGRKQKDTGHVGSGLWGKIMPTAMWLAQCFPVISASK